MALFRYRQDRVPVLIFTLVFALDLAVFFLVDDVRLLPLWTLLGILPKGFICAWNHHHQHVPTFTKTWANRLLEIVFAFETGLSTNAWVLHHTLGHHVNYLDQTKDESRWKDKDGKKMGELWYSLEVALTGYPRAWVVSRKYKQHRPGFIFGIVVVLVLLAMFFALRPWHALFVFLLPMIISLVGTAWATYTHHAGREAKDHFSASTNIIHRGYNIVTGNLGYHTAHHYRGGVHWSQLPKLHEEIKHLIPADAYMSPGFPFGLNRPCPPPDDVKDIAPRPASAPELAPAE
jgi:fatty acid desaturase